MPSSTRRRPISSDVSDPPRELHGVRAIPDGLDPAVVHDHHMTTWMLETEETTTTTPKTTAKGWHPDPRAEHKLRFHDGDGWTEHATHFGPVPCSGCHR